MCVLVRESMYFFRYDPLLYSALGSEAKGRGGSVYAVLTYQSGLFVCIVEAGFLCVMVSLA